MHLYYSISPSFLLESKKIINELKKDDYVFVSAHTLEDVNKNYLNNFKTLTSLINKKKGRIIADVSKRTLTLFKMKNFNEFTKAFNIYALRIDFSLSLKEIISISQTNNIVINASTITVSDLMEIKKKAKKEIIAMHNYYPRKETANGLDQFIDRTMMCKECGIKVFAFISGNHILRGPLNEGLTTIESLRNERPYVSYIIIDKLNIVDAIFVADIDILKKDKELINYYQDNKIIPLFTNIKDNKLINKVFTNRIDSPNTLIRLKETREYASLGIKIKPSNTIKRMYGDITIDNINYKRYSGEVMILRDNFIKDKRVNVIGKIKKDSLALLTYIEPNDKLIFIK